MRSVVLPYFVGMSKGESTDGKLEIELTDEEFERLKKSFDEGHIRIDSDPNVDDIWRKAYEMIIDIERSNLEAFPEIVEDFFSWDEDFDGEVTDEWIEAYLDEMRSGINYPWEFYNE